MHLKTILNRVTNYKGFVFESASFDESQPSLTLRVRLRARSNGRAVCDGCGKNRPGYDRLPERDWSFVPLWQIAVLMVYAPRRVNCPACGVKVERLPWGQGKHQTTIEYRWFLARWARRLSWKEVAEIFHTSWDTVFRSVEYAVQWGIVNRVVKDVTAIGVDEIQWKRGHKYLTLVYEIGSNCRRLLWIGEDRKEATLHRFFDVLGAAITPTLQYVCSDMWRNYIQVIRERAGDAVHILDRYHVMAKLNKAIDEVRAGEARQLKQDGYEPLLKHSRWCLLKRPGNLSGKQTVTLKELLKYNLKSVRAYLLKEDFQRFWNYQSAGWARRFLNDWCTRTNRSKLEPMKKVAKTIRNHEELLLNWFRAKGEISAGIVEGLNNKAKLTIRKSYGFRSSTGIEVALFHTLGNLPEKKLTHTFC
jgi:transposase